MRTIRALLLAQCGSCTTKANARFLSEGLIVSTIPRSAARWTGHYLHLSCVGSQNSRRVGVAGKENNCTGNHHRNKAHLAKNLSEKALRHLMIRVTPWHKGLCPSEIAGVRVAQATSPSELSHHSPIVYPLAQ